MGDLDRDSASVEIESKAICWLSDAEKPLNMAALDVSGIVAIGPLLATKAEEGRSC